MRRNGSPKRPPRGAGGVLILLLVGAGRQHRLGCGGVGVAASLTAPLADGGISVLAVSPFDTDYLLVKAEDLERAVDVLRRRGHTIQGTAR
jgi:hypothetical protein